MSELIARLYEGTTKSTDPAVKDGVLTGFDIGEEESVDLRNGEYRLEPGFATAEGEDLVIRVYKTD